MYNLIKADFFKLRKALSYKILLIVEVALCLLLVGMMIYAANNLEIPEGVTISGDLSMSGFDGFLSSLTQVQFNITYLSIFAALFICSDFTNRTIVGALSTGHSRISVIFSKLIVYLVGAVGLLLVMPVLMTLLLTIINGFGRELTGELIGFMVRSSALYLLQNLAMACFCALLAYIFKSIGPVVGSAIGSLMILNILAQLNINETFTNILKLTFIWQAQFFVKLEQTGDILLCVAVGVLTILITTAAGYLCFKRTDLK